MKKLILGFALAVSAHSAHAVLDGNRNADQGAVIRTAMGTDAFVLLEKIHQLAPATEMNLDQYDQYLNAIGFNSKKFGEASVQVHVKELGEFHPKMAAVDSKLASIEGPLYQSSVKVIQSFDHKMVRIQTSNVMLVPSIILNARIITGDCKDKLNCTNLYQVYIDSVELEVARGYQTGGFSSAGGGK